MCFWLRQPIRDSYQILANSELKISSVAFGKCREEYHYFFAPAAAGRQGDSLFRCSDFKAVEVNSLFWTSSRELSFLFSECRRQHGG